MPTPQLKKYAEKSGKSLEEIESYWEEAKEQAGKKFKHGTPQFWAYVSGIVKRRAGLKESLTFGDFVLMELLDTKFDIDDSDIHQHDSDLISFRKTIDGHVMEFYASEYKGGWDIEFSEIQKDSAGKEHANYELTNNGNPTKVLSFVMAAIKKLIKMKDPHSLHFSAKKKDRSRADVYEKMFRRNLPGWEIIRDNDRGDINVYFTLKKKNA